MEGVARRRGSAVDGARWLGRVVAATIAVSVILGLVATAAGDDLEALGSGPGGLGGLPFVILSGSVVAGLIGAAPSGARREATIGRLLASGPMAVWLSFQIAAHALDPCSIGVVPLSA